MKLSIGEIFKNASELPEDQQLNYFRSNFSPALGKIIEYALEPGIVWDLPTGTPPYKDNELTEQESNLYSEIRRLYIFHKGTGDHVAAAKKELNFIQLLENVTVLDAKVLLAIKEKTLPYGFTRKQMVEIFPGLLTELQEEPKPQAKPIASEPVKRGRGRPRKNPESATTAPKAKAPKKAAKEKKI
jgi:hypothetical protein